MNKTPLRLLQVEQSKLSQPLLILKMLQTLQSSSQRYSLNSAYNLQLSPISSVDTYVGSNIKCQEAVKEGKREKNVMGLFGAC